jgi:hypothetical protein
MQLVCRYSEAEGAGDAGGVTGAGAGSHRPEEEEAEELRRLMGRVGFPGCQIGYTDWLSSGFRV